MITISKLSKEYKKQVVFNNIELQIPENKITFISGPNGSGKSTLLKCLLNLENYHGEIKYNDQPLEKVREQVLVVYDNSPLYHNLTGLQNLELLSNQTSNKIHEKNHNILMPHFLKPEILKNKVKSYSLGQRKKLSLMIALVTKPKYLFLDEASNGLDHDTLIDLKIILETLSGDTTIVAIGHHFEYYTSIIDDLILIHDQSAIQIKDFKLQEGEGLNDIYKRYIK
ncbi:ABC transporter ATP-binding protein [Paenibacillus sp. PCH8]|uniref:ATP-binding cassette domain-containing protein n=1 Tax=Paenibacillus sp. PCH8 TaxID=2066524 RepID=UPI000CF90579|nr:ATP-binding cassette domain-containing protein [Paenibacillus sp. PCH8]PQP83089.1 ABC transporter ATP-binding protein [Paenibacillus sp. PCH8]